MKYADYYVGLGVTIVPLNGKIPAIDWKPFQYKKPTAEQIESWKRDYPANGIGGITGPISGMFGLDIDGEVGKRSVAGKELPDTWAANTPRGGFHHYYSWEPRFSDFVTTNTALLPGIDTRGHGGLLVLPNIEPGRSWLVGHSPEDLPLAKAPQWLIDLLPKRNGQNGQGYAPKSPGWIASAFNGLRPDSHNRNVTFASIAGRLHREHWSETDILSLLSPHGERCGFNPDELEGIIQSVLKYPHLEPKVVDAQLHSSVNPPIVPWPKDLASEAFYGLAGDFVKTLDPHTEADQAAILASFLVGFGNVIGRGPHFRIGHTSHFLNLFAVLVGNTSIARKGTSWNPVAAVLSNADAVWVDNRISGLSSGEGLIWCVRDPIVTRKPIIKDGQVEKYLEIETDRGISDKRLLVIEEEFGRVLKVSGRDGCTLSDVIRQAWDHGKLNVITKNNPAKATDAHISIIGHITKDELLHRMSATETSNGFANRFLWIAVKRSKCLPHGGDLPEREFLALQNRVTEVVEFAKFTGEIKRDAEANKIWEEVYEALSEGKPGLIGAVTGRGAPQVVRLSCLYALLDKSKFVRPEHLMAALAFWERAEASVKYIFGSLTGDPIADRIMTAFQTSTRLTQTEISNLFYRHIEASRLGQALSILERDGVIKSGSVNTGGRPEKAWELVQESDHA